MHMHQSFFGKLMLLTSYQQISSQVIIVTCSILFWVRLGHWLIGELTRLDGLPPYAFIALPVTQCGKT